MREARRLGLVSISVRSLFYKQFKKNKGLMMKVLLGLALLGLVGCGGSKGEVPAPTPEPAAVWMELNIENDLVVCPLLVGQVLVSEGNIAGEMVYDQYGDQYTVYGETDEDGEMVAVAISDTYTIFFGTTAGLAVWSTDDETCFGEWTLN